MVGAIEIAALGRGLGKHDAVLPGGPAFQYGFKPRLAPPDDDHVACTACNVPHVDVDAAHRLAPPIDPICRVILRSEQTGFLRRTGTASEPTRGRPLRSAQRREGNES